MLDLSAVLTTGVGVLLLALGQAHGWPVAVGGSRAIADALVARIQRLGGQVRCGHKVRSMADVPACWAVLFDVTPRQQLAIAGERYPPATGAGGSAGHTAPGGSRWTGRWRGPTRGQITRRGRDAPRRPGRGGGGSRAGRCPRGHPERPFMLFAQAMVADPSRASVGHDTGWGYCHVPHGSTVDMTDAIEAQVERFAGAGVHGMCGANAARGVLCRLG